MNPFQAFARPAVQIPSVPDGYLRLDNLCKHYQEGGQTRHVLENTSLEAAEGEVVAILGKSGSGKTTLLNLISGIDRVDCGEVYLAGTRLTGLTNTTGLCFAERKLALFFSFSI
jgi:putative ABC transport system ATP-binding protein